MRKFLLPRIAILAVLVIPFLFVRAIPWVNVKDAPYNAVCNGTTDDTIPVQSAIAANPGGTIFFPGPCLIRSALSITNAGTCLVGHNPSSSAIISNDNITMIVFAANTAYSCIRDLAIYGYRASDAGQNLVVVGNNALVNMDNCIIAGGNVALSTAGVDGHVNDCTINGWGSGGGSIASTGANWYKHNRVDQGATPVTFGFIQSASTVGPIAENHFEQWDLSGSYAYSVIVDDPASIVVFSDAIFSSPVHIYHAKWTKISGTEFGSTDLMSDSPLTMVGNFAFNPTTVSGAGARKCAANTNFTNC